MVQKQRINAPTALFFKITCVCLLLYSGPAFGYGKAFMLNKDNTNSIDFDVDPYFSYLGFNTSLVKGKPEFLDVEEETGMYTHMINNFFIPRTVRLEFSANPLPIFGVYFKDEQPQWYSSDGDATIATGIIRGVSAGFPDPGAISFFLGNRAYVANYTTGEVLGVFYGGGLLNYGMYHILNNTMYKDHWVEGELKLKGQALTKKSDFSTSYRMGWKIHFHDDIKNTLFVSIKRDRTDREYMGWSPFKNSYVQFRFDVSPFHFKATKFSAVAGKKVPFKGGKYVFSLAAGTEWISHNGYTQEFYQNSFLPGEQDKIIKSKWNIIIQPNLKF